MVSKGRGDLDISLNLTAAANCLLSSLYGNGNHENRMNQERGMFTETGMTSM